MSKYNYKESKEILREMISTDSVDLSDIREAVEIIKNFSDDQHEVLCGLNEYLDITNFEDFKEVIEKIEEEAVFGADQTLEFSFNQDTSILWVEIQHN